MKQIQTTIYSHHNGQEVIKMTLENDKGTRISVLNYGGIWQEWSVLDNKRRVNLLLMPSTFEDYINNPYYINRVVSRVAGRITKAQFTLNGKLFQTIPNEGHNSLHGGPENISDKFFSIQADDTHHLIRVSIDQLEQNDSFPGDLHLAVEYSLSEDDQVQIKFIGQQSNTDGLFNPTSHVYFNFDDSDLIDDYQLKLKSSRHLELDSENLPTGKLLNNTGDFNFSNPNNFTIDLDDVFEITDEYQSAILTHDQHQVQINSNRNGMVVFTGNGIPNSTNFLQGNGHSHIGLALEAQTLSDSMHYPEFGDITINNGQTRIENIAFQYRKL